MSSKTLFIKTIRKFSENVPKNPSNFYKIIKNHDLFKGMMKFDESILKFLHCPITKDELEYDPNKNALVSKKLVSFKKIFFKIRS